MKPSGSHDALARPDHEDGPQVVAQTTWWDRHASTLVRDVVVAVTAGAVFLVAGFVWDARQTRRDERLAESLARSAEALENVRFVRSTASTGVTVPRPFTGMELEGASLSNLNLGCKLDGDPQRPLRVWIDEEAHCANFTGADLSRADLSSSLLNGGVFTRATMAESDMRAVEARRVSFAEADLSGADFSKALLAEVSLAETNLTGTRLTDATIAATDLRAVDLSASVDLETAQLVEVCHDQATRWPEGFEPPASDCLPSDSAASTALPR